MRKNIKNIIRMIHSYDFQLQTGERDHQEGAIHDGRMYRTLSGTYSFLMRITCYEDLIIFSLLIV
jgi:hypothetical protein